MGDRKLRELERLALSDPRAGRDLATARVRSGHGNQIDAAHLRWAGGDPSAGFEELRQLWEERPAPELAQALSTASEHLARPRGAVTGRTRALLVRSWHVLDAEGDCFDVPRLLDALPLVLGGQALGLVESLEDWPSDPRVSQGLLRLLRQPPQGWAGRKHAPLWRACLAQIERIGDPRALDELEACRSPSFFPGCCHPDEFLGVVQGRLPGLLESWPAAPKLSDDERASLRTFLSSLGGGKESLWAAVYEDPSSLEARRALGQALEAEGDPRGEFIRLQLERGPGGKISAREARLARDHWLAWGGTLTGLGELRFEGGFPYALRVSRDGGTPPEPRELRTLRRVRLENSMVSDFLEVFPSLPPEVFGLPLKRFASAPCEVVGLDRIGPVEVWQLSRHCPANLRALELYEARLEPSDLDVLWDSPLGAQLEHFSIDPETEFSPWLALAPSLARAKQLQTFRVAARVTWNNEPAMAVLWRGPQGAFSRLLIRRDSLFQAQVLLKSLKLPDCVTHVRVEVKNAALERAKPQELRVVVRLLAELSEEFEIAPI